MTYWIERKKNLPVLQTLKPAMTNLSDAVFKSSSTAASHPKGEAGWVVQNRIHTGGGHHLPSRSARFFFVPVCVCGDGGNIFERGDMLTERFHGPTPRLRFITRARSPIRSRFTAKRAKYQFGFDKAHAGVSAEDACPIPPKSRLTFKLRRILEKLIER